MARPPRGEIYTPDEIAIVHTMARCVRQSFLMGYDATTGKNYDHRKEWIEKRLEHLAAGFAIDLLSFAILENHFHLVLRSRPDLVQGMTDAQIARKWLAICPPRNRAGKAIPPTPARLNKILNDPKEIARIRSRLSDISWWMRQLTQPLAAIANREDGKRGHFFEDRFAAVRLHDEASVLACSAYVDLNVIRAALADDLRTSAHTSIQRRLQSESEAVGNLVEEVSGSASAAKTRLRPDRHLAPLTIDELRDAIGAVPSQTPYRASDKGFLPIPLDTYRKLLEWTMDQTQRGPEPWTDEQGAGAEPSEVSSVLKQAGLDKELWCQMTEDFDELFRLVAGLPSTIANQRMIQSGRRFPMPRAFQKQFTGEPPVLS